MLERTNLCKICPVLYQLLFEFVLRLVVQVNNNSKVISNSTQYYSEIFQFMSNISTDNKKLTLLG